MSLVSLKEGAITEACSTFLVVKLLTEKLNTYKFAIMVPPFFLFPYLYYIYIISQNCKSVNNDFIGFIDWDLEVKLFLDST